MPAATDLVARFFYGCLPVSWSGLKNSFVVLAIFADDFKTAPARGRVSCPIEIERDFVAAAPLALKLESSEFFAEVVRVYYEPSHAHLLGCPVTAVDSRTGES